MIGRGFPVVILYDEDGENTDPAETGETGEGGETGESGESGGGSGGSTIVYEVDLTEVEEKLDKLQEFLEDWRETTIHPALTTNFADYTVTEGLLLLLLVSVVVKSCVSMLKRGFSWLL